MSPRIRDLFAYLDWDQSVVNYPVDYSPRGACETLLSVRETGGCRTPQDCSPSRLPSTAIGIRQTLSDCREHNGIMERRLSDRVSGAASTQVSVCRRGANLPMVGGYHNCGIRGTENNSSRYQPLRSCLSAIPHSLELPLTDMAFSIPKHWIALHTGARVQ